VSADAFAPVSERHVDFLKAPHSKAALANPNRNKGKADGEDRQRRVSKHEDQDNSGQNPGDGQHFGSGPARERRFRAATTAAERERHNNDSYENSGCPRCEHPGEEHCPADVLVREDEEVGEVASLISAPLSAILAVRRWRLSELPNDANASSCGSVERVSRGI